MIKNYEEYLAHYKNASNGSNNYWSDYAQNFKWFKKWNKVQSGSLKTLDVKWFEGAQTNLTLNIIEKNLEKNAHKIAVTFEPNNPQEKAQTFTYAALAIEVQKLSNVLKNQGIKKGDVVCLYMGLTPELLFSVLACARIGAIHSVIFGGFSAISLADRINDCNAKMLITHDVANRGDKKIYLKNIADEALEKTKSVNSVIVVQREKEFNDDSKMISGRDVFYHELMKTADATCAPEIMEAEDPLFILYTSGSTGSPKGLLHTTAGYMIWAAYTFQNVFQVGEKDIFWCTADIGWITGHSYLAYGPLLNGASVIMFEGIPTFPDASRFWQIIDKYSVTHFYTAPTAIRALEAQGLKFVEACKLDSLKVLGTVGEPINVEAWDWYYKNIGKSRCPIVDTWWQTETGGIMISNLAGVTPHKPAHATTPLPGVNPILVDVNGVEVLGNPAEGNLCLKTPWPGIARTVFGDHKRYEKTYFEAYPGYYFTGDGARRDELGNYRITGRVDDVINVSGHRLGTAEIESALNQHGIIVESAVIGYPHPIKGQGIYAFVIASPPLSKENEAQARKSLNEMVTKIIGAIARPDLIQFVPGLPKTRSGKIMRRILRKIAGNDLQNIGDTSTLLNPEIVELIIKGKLV
jgi:acetyl-CoA synthetase